MSAVNNLPAGAQEAIIDAVDCTNNPPYFDKLPKWPEARNELLHRLYRAIAPFFAATTKPTESTVEQFKTEFIKELKRSLLIAQGRIAALESERKNDFWIWQGDGNDKLEGLGCHVLIHADKLRAFVAQTPDNLREAQAAVATILTSGEFWRKEYADLDREKLISIAIMRSVCREADLAEIEKLRADLSDREQLLAVAERQRDELKERADAWKLVYSVVSELDQYEEARLPGNKADSGRAHVIRTIANIEQQLNQSRNVVMATRLASTEAMDQIRAVLGVPKGADDKTPNRVIDYVRELKASLIPYLPPHPDPVCPQCRRDKNNTEHYFADRDKFVAYVHEQVNPPRSDAHLPIAEGGLAAHLYDVLTTGRYREDKA